MQVHTEYLGQVYILRSSGQGRSKKNVCVSCLWVVCFRLKGDVVVHCVVFVYVFISKINDDYNMIHIYISLARTAPSDLVKHSGDVPYSLRHSIFSERG